MEDHEQDMSRAELAQELAIVEAELQAEKATTREQRAQIDTLTAQLEQVRDAAKSGDVAQVTALVATRSPAEQERYEIALAKDHINEDLQAIAELRNPPAPDAPVETTLDIVRANQRERAELQARTAKANTTLSRIASALRFDRWDESADKMVERVNAFVALESRINTKLKALRKELEHYGSGNVTAIWIGALEWVLGTVHEKPPVDYNAPRLINFVINGHDTPVDAKPEQTIGYLLSVALVRSQNTHKPVEEWLVYMEDGSPVKPTMSARELKASSVVATLPIGAGA